MFAALIMINKAVSGLGVFLSGVILWAVGFPDKAEPATLDPAIVRHLAWLFVLSVGGACTLAVVCLAYYPISREMHERILQQLRQRSS
ncbi:MAG TPA: hypothetical protein VHE37_15750, partial [Nevskiaceae bacterium]|nr:hypothetical protein [Nevskiaceae bacterium]